MIEVTSKVTEVRKMVNVDKLRGIIAERGLSQRKVAERLGMTEKTWCLWNR